MAITGRGKNAKRKSASRKQSQRKAADMAGREVDRSATKLQPVMSALSGSAV